MKIPKPLLIVIVIIVILGVVSCGAGVVRGLNEESKPAPGNAGSQAGFDQDPVPVPFADVTLSGGCAFSDADGDGAFDDIAISSACDVTIERQFFRSRVLRLAVFSIPLFGTISVQQVVGGRLQPDPPDPKGFNTGQVFEISASGVGAVHVTIGCSCTLSVIAT